MNKPKAKTVVLPIMFTRCRDCPYARNTAMDHDDPFTSTPIPIWYCTHPGNKWINEEFVIQDLNEIDKRCQL